MSDSAAGDASSSSGLTDEPRNEEEFLKRESQLARDGLQRLRGEMLDSLSRTADPAAWTKRYPWQSLGTVAVAGVAAGWGIGRTIWRGRSAASDRQPGEGRAYAGESPATSTAPHPTSRLVAGLGTLAGALASAAVAAAVDAVKDVVKDSIHESFHPDVTDQEVDGQNDG